MHVHGSAYPYEHEWADRRMYSTGASNTFGGLLDYAYGGIHCHGHAS